MTSEIVVETESTDIGIDLNGTDISSEILNEIPFESRVSTWGDEIYFAVPVEASAEKPTRDVHVGDVAYWPKGKSLAIFFGPTPQSDGDQPVPADDVSIVGTVSTDIKDLDNVEAGESITIQES
ncbi:MAG: cyclophilin-like fold protein [bacterium]